MSFTILSAVFFGLVGVAVFIEVIRGLKRGLTRALVGLMTVVLSALGAAPLAVRLSDLPSKAVYEWIYGMIPLLEKNSTVFPSLGPIVEAAVDAVLSLLLFVILFMILRLILRIVVAALFRGRLGRGAVGAGAPDSARGMHALFAPSYEAVDAPWYRRHERLLTGLTSGLCGFLAALCMLSPLVGTMSLLGYAYSEAKAIRVNFSKVVDEQTVALVEPYLSDASVGILSAMGGELIFDAVTVTELEGETLSLRREAETVLALTRDFVSVSKVFAKLDQASEEQLETLSSLGPRIGESLALRLIAADFLNGAANNWLEGKRFFSIARPRCGEIIDPIMDEALLVCKQADKDCVARDITTIINIYVIAAESGLIGSPNQETLMEALDEGDVLDRIYTELRRNPCMAHLADRLTGTAMQLMAKAIDWADFKPGQYEALLGDLTGAITEIGEMGERSFEEQVGQLTDYTVQIAERYGIKIPESMAEMAATTMLSQLGSVEDLTAEDLEQFFNQYTGG